jgi:polyphosphate kinase
VIYGLANLKVHAKALLIIRREERGVKRYAHLGTGNYHDKTAKALHRHWSHSPPGTI